MISLLSFYLSQKRDFFREMNLDTAKFITYIRSVEDTYDSSLNFHSSLHPADVAQACHVLMNAPLFEVIIQIIFSGYTVIL